MFNELMRYLNVRYDFNYFIDEVGFKLKVLAPGYGKDDLHIWADSDNGLEGLIHIEFKREGIINESIYKITGWDRFDTDGVKVEIENGIIELVIPFKVGCGREKKEIHKGGKFDGKE